MQYLAATNLAGINGGESNQKSIIFGIDQKEVKAKPDIVNCIDTKSPGDNVTLRVVDNVGIHTITTHLGELMDWSE